MSTQHTIEVTGATVEEAIVTGLEQLGVEPSQVIVEVLEEPSRGLFGLGSKVARVRLQLVNPPQTPQAKTPPTSISAPIEEPTPIVSENVPTPEAIEGTSISTYYGDDDDFFNEDGSYIEDAHTPAQASPEKHERREAQQDNERNTRPEGNKRRGNRSRGGEHGHSRRSERDERHGKGKREESDVITPPILFEEGANELSISEQVLVELFDLMDIPVEMNSFQSEAAEGDEGEPPWVIDIKGDDEKLQGMVGRKGDTLASLQYLTRLIVSKQTENRANIVVDINSYRTERSEKLKRLANRMADQAIETERTVIMEPMPPHERRIIHMVLRGREDVETESTGHGESRRVTIIPNNLSTPQI